MQEEQEGESVFLCNTKKSNVFNVKTMRLTNPKDFKKCFQSGKRAKNKAFSLYYLENGNLAGRLGVNIAKSKVKRAVDRNKIKRRVKEIFRENKIHSALNHSIMFSVFKPFSELTYKEASCEIIKAMKEADKQ